MLFPTKLCCKSTNCAAKAAVFRNFHGIYSLSVGGDNYANVCSNWQLSLLKWHLAAPGYFAVITAALVPPWPVTAGTDLSLLSVSIITRWNIDNIRDGLKFYNHGEGPYYIGSSPGWKCLLALSHLILCAERVTKHGKYRCKIWIYHN